MTQQKKSVMFAVNPEWGGFMPMLALAKAFSLRKWDVLFVVPRADSELIHFNNQQLPEYKKYIEKNGFQCKLLRPFPPPSKGLLAEVRRVTEVYANVLEDVIQVIKECNVELVLIDSLISFVAIAAAECEVPYVGLGTEFSGPMNSIIPPSNSSLIPDESFLSRLMTIWEWSKHYLQFKLITTFHPKAILMFGPQAFLNRRMYGAGLTKTFWEYGSMVKFPCFYYLIPQALDFAPRPKSKYLGNCIDLSRIDEDFKLDQLSGMKPLIYCSLGTRSWEYNASKRFFRIALETFRQRQDYEFVLNIGNTCEVEDLGEIPKNVYVCHWVPQLAVLQRSSMMITNGGMNTVKECIYLGVPMIVLPVTSDQFSNAARVVHHGLGVRGNLKRIKPQQLSRLIHKISNDSNYLKNLERMQKEFMCTNEFEAAIDFLETK